VDEVFCTETTSVTLTRFAERAKNDPAWSYREVNACHDVMVTEPEALADLLLDIAGPPENTYAY
jgi:hypothetical protein